MAEQRHTSQLIKARQALDAISEWIPSAKLRAELIGKAISASRELVGALEAQRLDAVPDARLPQRIPAKPLYPDESAVEQMNQHHFERGWNACIEARNKAIEATRKARNG